MKKFMISTIIGIILVTLLVPSILSDRQALAQKPKIGEGVQALWPEAQIQVGEITLTNFFLAAGIGESEEGIEKTVVRLSWDSDICTAGTLGCSVELTTRDDDVLRINGFSSATLSPVTLDICIALDEFGECADTLPVTLQAKFEGFGSVESGNLLFPEPGSDSGHPPFLVHVHGNSRDAIATGSLNGQDLGQSTEAIIFRNIIF